MKKISLFALALVFLSAPVFAAPDRTGKIDMGITLGGVFPENDDLSSGGYIGGQVEYGVNSWFAVGVSSGFCNDSGLEVTLPSGLSVPAGDVTIVPVFVDLIFRWQNKSQFVPYAVLGLGAVIPYAESDGLSAQNLKANKEVDFAAKFGLGVDWFLNKNWILNAEGHYVATSAGFDVKNDNTQQVVQTKDVDYWYFGGGVKYLYE